MIVFLDLLFLSEFLVLWQPWASFSITWMSVSDKIAVNVSSRSSSLMLSGIPNKVRLFLQPYCFRSLISRSLIDYCRTPMFFSKQSYFACNCALSSWSLFVTMSFKLLKSSLKLNQSLFNESVVIAISIIFSAIFEPIAKFYVNPFSK